MNVRAPLVSVSGRKGRSRNGASSASAVWMSELHYVCMSFKYHTSRLHLGRANMYELLHLLWHDCLAVPIRLPSWLRGNSIAIGKICSSLALGRRLCSLILKPGEERHSAVLLPAFGTLLHRNSILSYVSRDRGI